jgi:hypothetical protein
VVAVLVPNPNEGVAVAAGAPNKPVEAPIVGVVGEAPPKENGVEVVAGADAAVAPNAGVGVVEEACAPNNDPVVAVGVVEALPKENGVEVATGADAAVEPNAGVELPKAGVAVLPNAGVELPKAPPPPKTGVAVALADGVLPNNPADVVVGMLAEGVPNEKPVDEAGAAELAAPKAPKVVVPPPNVDAPKAGAEAEVAAGAPKGLGVDAPNENGVLAGAEPPPPKLKAIYNIWVEVVSVKFVWFGQNCFSFST